MQHNIDPGLWPIIVFVALTGYAAFVSVLLYSPIFRFLAASLLPLLAVYALHVRAENASLRLGSATGGPPPTPATAAAPPAAAPEDADAATTPRRPSSTTGVGTSEAPTASARVSPKRRPEAISPGLFSALEARARYGDYRRDAVLGRGQLGVVVLLRSEGGDEVVSKQVRLDTLRGADLAQLENEVRLLSSMRHPHIVQYLTTFQDADALHILMEYARGGTLEQQIEQRARAATASRRRSSASGCASWSPRLSTCTGCAYCTATSVRRAIRRNSAQLF